MIRVLLVAVLACSVVACDYFTSDEMRMARARAAAEEGEYGKAVLELRRAIQNAPENLSLRLELAGYAEKAGEMDLVEREAEAVLASDKGNAEAARLLASALLTLGRADEVLRRIDSGGLPFDEPMRAVMRARALLLLERTEEAARELAEMEPTRVSPAAGVVLAELAASSGRVDEAMQHVEDVLTTDPEAAEAWLLKARLEASRGRFAAATDSFARVLEIPRSVSSVPARAAALAGLTETALAEGKTEKAAESVSRLRELAPGAVVTRFLLARVDLARGQYDDGVAQLQRLVLDAPAYVPARLLLATAHVTQGNYNQAEQQLIEAVQLAPRSIETRKLLARVRMYLDRPEEAITILDAVAANAVDPEIASLMSAAHAQAGDHAAALETLEHNVRQHPDDVEARLELAAAWLTSGRAAEAADLLARLPQADGGIRRAALEVAAIRAARGPAAAQRKVEALLERAPADAEIALLAGVFYGSQRDFERARTLLRSAAEKKNAGARPFLALARLESLAGATAAAESWAHRATQAAPQDASVWLTLSELQFQRRDFAAARQSLEKARKTAAVETTSRLGLVRVMFAQGEIAEAERALHEIAETSPHDPKLLEAIGKSLQSVERHDQALAYFGRAVDLQPNNPKLWIAMANSQLAVGAAGPARESFERAQSLAPYAIAPVAGLAMLDVRTGQSERALARVAELKRHRSGDAALYVLEGDVHMARKAFDAAIEAYTAAERLAPSAATAMKLFDALRSGDLANPQAPLQRWLAGHPDDTPVRSVLAQWLLQTGRLDEARIELETIVRTRRDSYTALNNLAWVYQQLGDARARATAERAREVAPHVPAIADTLAWILLQAGEKDRALALLQEAAKGLPDDPEVTYHLATALEATGRSREAAALLRELLETSVAFPARSDAQRLLERLESRQPS